MAEAEDGTIFAARARQRQEARDLLDALRGADARRVRALVGDALHGSHSLLYVVSHLVDSARREIEDLWYRGDIGMADERRMMGILEAIVRDASLTITSPMPAPRTCIMTTAAETPAVAINRGLLREDGWKVVELNASNLMARAETMRALDRRVVVLVGEAAEAIPDLKLTVASLHALGSRVLVVAPGHWGQAGRWHHLGADACAEDARTMLLLARKLFSADTTFSISEVAASLNVSPHAIRAWERRYRLPTPARDRGGQRRYTAEDVQLLFRVSHAATVRGHSLRLASLEAQGLLTEEVRDVLSPSPNPTMQVAEAQGQAWLQVADAIPDMLMLLDGEGKIVDCNVATARVRDTVRENLRGTRLADLVIDYDRAKAVRLYRPSPQRRDAWELRMRSAGDAGLKVVAFDSRVVTTPEGWLLGLRGRIVASDEPDDVPAVA